MDVLVFMIPIALSLGGLGLVAFLWALRNGQYDDIDGAEYRVLMDDDRPDGNAQEETGGPRREG